MAALGIPTTRALAAVTTGEPVWRETPLPGAVLTRVASSHIRVGTFQFFAARGDLDAIRRLADHVIARHYPEAVDAANRYRTLLDLVISRQAGLIAKWQLVGFIHGVMNTDNMSSPVWRRRSYRCLLRTRTLPPKRRKRTMRSPPASRRPMPRASATRSA